jgi:hypothetical protein
VAAHGALAGPWILRRHGVDTHVGADLAVRIQRAQPSHGQRYGRAGRKGCGLEPCEVERGSENRLEWQGLGGVVIARFLRRRSRQTQSRPCEWALVRSQMSIIVPSRDERPNRRRAMDPHGNNPWKSEACLGPSGPPRNRHVRKRGADSPCGRFVGPRFDQRPSASVRDGCRSWRHPDLFFSVPEPQRRRPRVRPGDVHHHVRHLLMHAAGRGPTGLHHQRQLGRHGNLQVHGYRLRRVLVAVTSPQAAARRDN